jgi:phenylpropionate dioxygenase-like ring-hydroxylating dioxygenase large terminal subunit
MRASCGTLKNHWYAAALSSKLPEGKPLSSVILETRLVLFRETNGQVAALRDRCAHRHLYLSAGEVIEGQAIRCKYHGWSYDRNGQCVNVPSEGPCGKAFAGRAVEAFPVQEQDGLIWVWMGGPDTPPDQDPMRLPPCNDEGWRGFFMETDFEASVTNCVENFIDVPHTVWVHPGWFRSRKGIQVPVTVERSGQEVLLTYDSQEDGFGWGDRLFNPKNLPLSHTDRFIMPNNTRVDYIWGQGERGFTIISTSVPVSPQLTKVYTLVNIKCGVISSAMRLFMRWYARQVITQDSTLMALQSRALSEAPVSFKHTPADMPHLFIESLRRWAEEGGHGEAPPTMVRTMDMWI